MPELGSPGPCCCNERHLVSQADSQIRQLLVAVVYFVLGKGESGVCFFPFAEDIILNKNVFRELKETHGVKLFYCQ